MRDCPKINKLLQDYEDANSYAIIRKDRGGQRRGGGIAIMYNKASIDMKRAHLPHSHFEVMAAVGRRMGQRKKIVILAAYVPPNYNADRSKNMMMDFLNDCLIVLFHQYQDPYVFLAGDFNSRDVDIAIRDHPVLKVVKTQPTRGTSVLDIIATNCDDLIVDKGVLRPIV